jgi:hypothetical protein
MLAVQHGGNVRLAAQWGRLMRLNFRNRTLFLGE